MNIALAIVLILIISFLWALFSLRKEFKKPKEIEKAKKELMKEKIIFHS